MDLLKLFTSWGILKSRLNHLWWGWVVSALAAFFATLAPTLIRILCLAFAVLVAVATFYRTEFARKRWAMTIPASVLFAVLAVGMFLGARYFDRRESQAKDGGGLGHNSADGAKHPTATLTTGDPSGSVKGMQERDLKQAPPALPSTVKAAEGVRTVSPVGGTKSGITPAAMIDFSAHGAASESQMAHNIVFDRVIVEGGVDLSGCVDCAVANSTTGTVKAGPETGVYNNWINGNVQCEKRMPAMENHPDDCRMVAVLANRTDGANSALDNTGGKIGEAYVSGNVVRPSLNGGTAKAVENYHGEIQKLTATNNDVGWPAEAAPMPSARALRGSNFAVADQLSQCVDRGHRIVGNFLADDDAQLVSEKEQSWEADARAALIANLGQTFADQFSNASSTGTTYPAGHNAKGGSICNLIDTKIAVLSRFINQLRTANR